MIALSIHQPEINLKAANEDISSVPIHNFSMEKLLPNKFGCSKP